MEREHGDVVCFEREKGFGFLLNSRREKVIFMLRDVRPGPRSLSRAWCFAEKGFMPVTFEAVGSGRKLQAVDVAPLFPLDEAKDPRDEFLVVEGRRFDYGWARRECGDSVFIHRDDVLEVFRDRWNLVGAGVTIYAGTIKLDDKGLPRAYDIELFSEEELRRMAEPDVEPEPKPEVLVLASAPVDQGGELFKPGNRSRTLLELMREKIQCQKN